MSAQERQHAGGLELGCAVFPPLGLSDILHLASPEFARAEYTNWYIFPCRHQMAPDAILVTRGVERVASQVARIGIGQTDARELRVHDLANTRHDCL